MCYFYYTMRKKAHILFTALILLILSAPLYAAGHRLIDQPELEAMMQDGNPIVIVDLREPALFRQGHIPGAINIPYDEAYKRTPKELKKDQRIVFVCHSGPMGDRVAGYLYRLGYRDLYNLKWGMKGWKGKLERGD